MVQQFTRIDFENALPVHRTTGAKLWTPLDLWNGEYSYLVPVGKFGAGILIRSSVDSAGVSAPTGEDSIRAYLVRTTYRNGRTPDIKPLSVKLQHHITRVSGWENRLKKVLRMLYKLGLHTRQCKVCGELLSIVRIRRGKNEGKYALACKTANCSGEFEVIRDMEPVKPQPIREREKETA